MAEGDITGKVTLFETSNGTNLTDGCYQVSCACLRLCCMQDFLLSHHARHAPELVWWCSITHARFPPFRVQVTYAGGCMKRSGNYNWSWGVSWYLSDSTGAVLQQGEWVAAARLQVGLPITGPLLQVGGHASPTHHAFQASSPSNLHHFPSRLS